MSATIDVDEYKKYFGGKTSVIDVEGRTFPIEHVFTNEPITSSGEFPPKYVIKVAETVRGILNDPKSRKGDILGFLASHSQLSDAYTIN